MLSAVSFLYETMLLVLQRPPNMHAKNISNVGLVAGRNEAMTYLQTGLYKKML